jgi:enoyl-CoA hydratase
VGTTLLAFQQENVLIFTLKATDGYPRLNRSVLECFAEEIARLNAVSAMVGAVITGAGESFAVGAEINEIAALRGADGFEFSRLGQSVCGEIERSRKPVVAAIRGYCMGGGMDLALACHERVAGADAVFAHPGGAIGIMTGWGGTQRLPRMIGRARALDLFLSGCRLSAEQARDCGLVSRIVDEVDVLQAAIASVRGMAVRLTTSLG